MNSHKERSAAEPQTNRFGLRREAKRHAALDQRDIQKAVASLRSATAVQIHRSLRTISTIAVQRAQKKGLDEKPPIK